MTIDEMIDDILRREGGYVDHPDDRGGPTNFGVTQKTLDSLGINKIVEDLTKSEAVAIYKTEYFYSPQIDTLDDKIHPVMLDMSVNHGPKNAIRILQKSIAYAGFVITIDGVIGNQTRGLSPYVTVAEITSQRVKFYAEIVANDHSQAVFLKGWLNRAGEFV